MFVHLYEVREIVLKDKVVRSSYVRYDNVYKLTTIFVYVRQHVRGGGCECNQHTLHRTGYIEIDKLHIVGFASRANICFKNIKFPRLISAFEVSVKGI